jgi:hypothetical protein
VIGSFGHGFGWMLWINGQGLQTTDQAKYTQCNSCDVQQTTVSSLINRLLHVQRPWINESQALRLQGRSRILKIPLRANMYEVPVPVHKI